MGDDPFDPVTSLFTQMYTIHAPHGDSSFPVAFARMVEKTTRAYEIVLCALKDSGVVIRMFMSDFERVSRNAIKNVHGSVCANGVCFMIHNQS